MTSLENGELGNAKKSDDENVILIKETKESNGKTLITVSNVDIMTLTQCFVLSAASEEESCWTIYCIESASKMLY